MRVLTYNVWCDGPNYNQRLIDILKVIKNENPDVIALQEVKYGSYDLIIKELNGYNHCLSNRVKYHRMYGEILLTKMDVMSSEYIPSNHSNNQRGYTVYKTDGFKIITTHLDIKNDKQVMELNSLIEENNRIVVLGDLNFFGELPKLKWVNDSDPNGINTFVSKEYQSRPDRIYYNRFYLVARRVIKFNGTSGSLSDHKCFIADLIPK